MNLKKLLGVTLLLTPMLGMNDVYASRHMNVFQGNKITINDSDNINMPQTTKVGKPVGKHKILKKENTISISKKNENLSGMAQQQLISDDEWAKIIEDAEKLNVVSIKELNGFNPDENNLETETLDSYTKLFRNLGENVFEAFYSLMIGAAKLENLGYKQSCKVSDDDFKLPMLNDEGAPDVFYTIDRNSFMDIVKNYVNYCERNSINYKDSFRNLSVSDSGDAIILSPAITLDAPISLLNWVEPITHEKIQNMENKTAINYSLITDFQKKTGNNFKNIQSEIENIKVEFNNVTEKLNNEPNEDIFYTKEDTDNIINNLKKNTTEKIESETSDLAESINNQNERLTKIEEALESLTKQFASLVSSQSVGRPEYSQPKGFDNDVTFDQQQPSINLEKNNPRNGKKIQKKTFKTKGSPDGERHKNTTILAESAEGSSDDQTSRIGLHVKTNMKGRSVDKEISQIQNQSDTPIHGESLDSEPNNKISIPDQNALNKKKNKKGKNSGARSQSNDPGRSEKTDSDDSKILAGDMTEEDFKGLLRDVSVKPEKFNTFIAKVGDSKTRGLISKDEGVNELSKKLGLSGTYYFKNAPRNKENLSKLYSLVFK